MRFLYFLKKNLLTVFILLFPFSELLAQCGASWLYIQPRWDWTQPNGVQIGDLDITGNQLTVEATYNCDWHLINEQYNDLVSKHCSSSDVNYLLRPSSAAITTTNGFYSVSFDMKCYSNEKVFHTAMVYDGSYLRIYFNGSLKAATPASGNLITNSWPARIGTEACNAVSTVDFIGRIYDVKIWNTARSQDQIINALWMDLSNPTSQTGLQAYYKFNSLANLQGNSAWNGTLLGYATIGFDNSPVCSNINHEPCYEPAGPVNCNYYLNVTTNFAGVNIGDLDLGGTQMTIEAIATRTTSYDPAGEGGDVVSKHSNKYDANYFLRPNAAAIRVGTEFYKIPALCPAQVGRTYHLAMVWNGSIFSSYRNGELQGSVNTISGKLGTNDWPARIGSEADQNTKLPIHFNGHINEVRFWNRARTHQEILDYMNKKIPTPYEGALLAYYIFNGYINRVFPAWDGSPFGPAGSVLLKTTTPECSPAITCNYKTAITQANVASEDVIVITEDFSISPNPIENKINLNINSKQDNLVMLKLYNMAGQLNQYQKLAIRKGLNRVEFKTKNPLPAGMYIIKVEYPTKTIQKKLIVR